MCSECVCCTSTGVGASEQNRRGTLHTSKVCGTSGWCVCGVAAATGIACVMAVLLHPYTRAVGLVTVSMWVCLQCLQWCDVWQQTAVCHCHARCCCYCCAPCYDCEACFALFVCTWLIAVHSCASQEGLKNVSLAVCYAVLVICVCSVLCCVCSASVLCWCDVDVSSRS